MSRLPELSYRQVRRALNRVGFIEHTARGKGSHRAFTNPDKPNLAPVIVPYRRGIKRGTLHKIINDAGLTVKEFLDLL